MTITDTAAALGVSRFTLSELVNAKRGISPEMAVRLSKAFGGSAESWLTQQAHYDLAHVQTEHIRIKRLKSALGWAHGMSTHMRQKPNDYERAEELFRDAELKEERGDFRGAFKNLSMAVRLGHVSSQINLGNFYANGKGVRKDFKEAARWYKKAYLSGRSAGAVNLSVDLQRQGNMRGAIAWLKRAAAMNDGDACVQLARLYMARRGGAKTAAALLKTALSLNRSETSDEAREQAQNMLKSMTTLL